METKICVFEENAISFAFDKENSMMINATEMAKAFGANVGHFLANEGTKKFIHACLNNRNSDYLNIVKEEDLVVARQKSGTWMHRVLALKFAAWLSPDFEVWVYATIEKLLFGKHVEREKSFEKTLRLQKEMNAIRDKAPEEKTGADFNRYLDIEREINREKVVRKNLTTESISGMRSLFEEDETDDD
ncbi:KilA-N domain-containing protein [Proteiniphilum sp.]|nr:KilA-N domain-containing protein [Proteiniphilum sp.]MEA4918164.1 KilA-N domain-containing protein [Proteiniphilum sp.]